MKIILFLLGGSILLAGCGLFSAMPAPVLTTTALPRLETATDTLFPSPAASATLTQTLTPSPSPTPAWIHQGPGDVVVPILLYHHIGISPINSRYYVPPVKFEAEIKLLHDWGYTSISTELLAKAISEGAELPPRPIILSFDDGNLDNYTNAFPIMQKYGFTGTLFIVGNYIGAELFMDVDQIKEMAAAGWEVGSHGMRHLDLTTLDTQDKRYEIVKSREFLQEKLGVPIISFAYPFGLWSPGSVDFARFAGYLSAVGTDSYGFSQNIHNIFTMERAEIKSSDDARTFIRFLPWQGDPAFLPTVTPTPTSTPSRTPIPTNTPKPTRTPAP